MKFLSGVLGAIGMVVLTVAILYAMIWGVGHPSVVSWWRPGYLIGGFVALLVGTVIVAARSKKKSAAADDEQTAPSAGASLLRAIGVVLGALLLIVLLSFLRRH